MPLSTEQLVQQIHDSPTRIVLAATGGGSRAIADLLEVPGGSRTFLEAVVPYSPPAWPPGWAARRKKPVRPPPPGQWPWSPFSAPGSRRVRDKDGLQLNCRPTARGWSGLHGQPGHRSAETRPASRSRRPANGRPHRRLVAATAKGPPHPGGRGAPGRPTPVERRGRGVRTGRTAENRIARRRTSASSREPKRRKPGKTCSWARLRSHVSARPAHRRKPSSPGPSIPCTSAIAA